MTTEVGPRALLVALLIVTGSAAYAHHSQSTIDRSKPVQFVGSVTEFIWRLPHVYLKVDSITDSGEVVEYTIEALNPTVMSKAGWSKDSLKPGERVVWAGAHDRDPNRAYAALDWVERPGQQRMFSRVAALGNYLDEQGLSMDAYLGLAPPDAAKRVGEGMWSRIGSSGRRFPPIRRPKPDWPYTELGAAEVAAYTEANNPLNECEQAGLPKSMLGPLNYRFSTPDEVTILLEQDLMTEPRVIHLAANAPVGEPNSYGHSIGRYDGEHLIVETRNFVATHWGTYTGLSSSEKKTVQEKYWLSEGGMRLNVEITVMDPMYLTRPVTITHQWKKIANRPTIQAECSVENANFYLTAGYEDE